MSLKIGQLSNITGSISITGAKSYPPNTLPSDGYPEGIVFNDGSVAKSSINSSFKAPIFQGLTTMNSFVVNVNNDAAGRHMIVPINVASIDTSNSFSPRYYSYRVTKEGFYWIGANVGLSTPTTDYMVRCYISIVISKTAPEFITPGAFIKVFDKDLNYNSAEENFKLLGSGFVNYSNSYSQLKNFAGNASRFEYCDFGDYISVYAYVATTNNKVANPLLNFGSLNIHYIDLY